ncbi:MAG: hypothetical protein K2R93_16310 [Gemmatimonadaceae bacterium]|nr:hypothetical protein [Gemmatimonadaceae bacterium]
MRRALLALSVALTLHGGARAQAQQTIINAPSTDQTERGRWFALHESQARNWGGERFWQTTHFLTYGVTAKVEAAVTAYNLGTPLKRFSAVGLGWKTAQPVPGVGTHLEAWEPRIGAGQMVVLPLRGERVGLWSYAHGSVRVPSARTRVTAGISNGPPALFGKATAHFVGSVEQPLAPLPGAAGHRLHHVTLLAEWWSGRHEFADLVTGLSHHRHGTVLIAGYKFGNLPGTRGDGLVIEIGRTF